MMLPAAISSSTTTSIDEEIDNLTQMELRRRRQSFIFLLFFFFLIRLWLQAMLTGDSGLLPLCIILTIWFARIQHQRRFEDEELQSQWQQVLGRQQQQQQQSREGVHTVLSSNNVNAVDLRHAMDHVPFQLQLAIAMLESQRMMQAVAANGNLPIRMDQGNNSRGVSEEVRAQWKHYKFGGDDRDLQKCATSTEALGFTNNNGTEPLTERQLSEEEKNNKRQTGATARNPNNMYSIFHRAFASRRRRQQSDNNTEYSMPSGDAAATASDGSLLSSRISRKRDQYTSLVENTEDEENINNELYLSPEEQVEGEEEGSFENNNAISKPTTTSKLEEDDLLREHVVSTLEEEAEFSCCSICLEPYVKGDDIVELTCKHIFHDECISVWTSNNVKCPLCNFDLELGNRDLV